MGQQIVSYTELGDPGMIPAPTSEDDLDELLSRPTPGVLEALAVMEGDLLILGVAGKMGPTLARMARRGLDELGKQNRVMGVARFSNEGAAAALQHSGIEPVRCDLLDRSAVERLPDAPNVIFMAGQKFGTTGNPELTWAMNTLVPAFVAERYSRSQMVAFSTGCVYPNSPVGQGGSREGDLTEPSGDYANSCVGRERIFTYYSKKQATRVALMRLNYAIDLRYGVLLDVASKVWNGEPIDVSMGYVNVIWQGDANAQAIRLLDYASSPPLVINITGPQTVSIRALAIRFGELLEREPVFSGHEAPDALLSNAELSHRLFDYPRVSLEQMALWVAAWVREGGPTLNKPTHYETRDGRY